MMTLQKFSEQVAKRWNELYKGGKSHIKNYILSEDRLLQSWKTEDCGQNGVTH